MTPIMQNKLQYRCDSQGGPLYHFMESAYC